VERDNAEISLLVGTCAATLMLEARTGILRTVPAPDERTVAFLRRAALALGIDWPEAAPAGDVLAGLDRTEPRQFAFVEHAAALLRGASYTPFHGELPEQTYHAGIGAPYAHVTAPLRRLVDRFGTEVCLAAHAGTPLPEWVAAALDTLPTEMRTADRLAHDVDRAVVDATEAWLLRDRVGQRFSAVVIDADDNAATVVLDDPAVRARCDGAGLPVGTRIGVRLTEADVRARRVRFRAEPIDAPRPASAP
jgi:exoribonuclease R